MSHVFSDKENIHACEQWLESVYTYGQRVSNAVVVGTGLATGVRTTIVMPPTVWGAGTGLVNRFSMQIPVAFAAALRRGRAFRVSDYPQARYSHVHAEDFARLYEILLERVVGGQDVPHGERGFLFANAGEFAWPEFWERAAKALYKRGRIESEELLTLTLKEAADELCGGDEHIVEVAFAAK